jgi:hypothetical protein
LFEEIDASEGRRRKKRQEIEPDTCDDVLDYAQSLKDQFFNKDKVRDTKNSRKREPKCEAPESEESDCEEPKRRSSRKSRSEDESECESE